MERFKLVTAVHLILIEDKKILLQKRYNTGYEDGNYSIVAGHIDGNESVIKAMQREALEEAGIKIKEEDLEIVHVMHRKTPDRESIDYFLTCKKYDGKIKIMEKDKCDELKFYKLDELPINVIPYVKKGIENYLNNEPFSIMVGKKYENLRSQFATSKHIKFQS
jgi:hydrolase, NUDIX family